MIVIKKNYLLVVLIICASCGGNKGPQAPTVATLVFPEINSECTTGETVSTDTSRVTFSWNASANTSTYELVVTNLDANTTQRIEVNSPEASLVIAKGTPFSWSVTSKSAAIAETAKSAVWRFFNAGGQTSFAPFPADAVAPLSGSTVNRDINNQVNLIWTAADIDNDILSSDIFFDTVNPPLVKAGSVGPDNTSLKVDVVSGALYYWQVVTKDEAEHSVTSNVFQFKTY